MAQIEFYVGDAAGHIAYIESDAVPRAGEYVNIRNVTYSVERVTWAVDRAGEHDASLRANVVLTPSI
jgi:hypothetical protein